MGAEADTVAGIPTGQTENIRPVVAAMRRAIHNRAPPISGEVSTDTRSVGSLQGGFFCDFKAVLNEKIYMIPPTTFAKGF